MLSIEQVERGVVRVRMSSWSGRRAGYGVSAWLLNDVLVDTGFPRAGNELLGAVRELRPRGAILTHWHEDHAGNAPLLASEGLPLFLHPLTERTLRERPPIGLYRRLVWGRPGRLTAPVVAFDVAPLEIIPTPGHTPDHLAVWDAERRIVVSGDLFLGVKVRIAHHNESPRLLVQSLRAVTALEPRLLLDAHRGVVEQPASLLRAKIAWMEETIGAIASLAAQGIGEREIRKRVLGKEELTGYASAGEYSRRALVHAVLAEPVSRDRLAIPLRESIDLP
jgi:glyoxylase-like metal-dependent hydrolase (beta-lactamase superfamily II)